MELDIWWQIDQKGAVCVGLTSDNSWQFGWEALTAIGTIGSAIVALALSLAPAVSSRRSWRKVAFNFKEDVNHRGEAYGEAHIVNNSDRGIFNVSVDIYTVDNYGQSYFDAWRTPFIEARSSKTFSVGYLQLLETEEQPPLHFTDWTGKSRVIKADQRFKSASAYEKFKNASQKNS